MNNVNEDNDNNETRLPVDSEQETASPTIYSIPEHTVAVQETIAVHAASAQSILGNYNRKGADIWYIPHEVRWDTTHIIADYWKVMLSQSGYLHRDFAGKLRLATSTFSERYACSKAPLNVIARKALIELLTPENFSEALGRVHTGTKRKYLLSYELRRILARYNIKLSTFAEYCQVSQPTITRYHKTNGKNDVSLRMIDVLIKMIGIEKFTRNINQMRGPLSTQKIQYAWRFLDPDFYKDQPKETHAQIQKRVKLQRQLMQQARKPAFGRTRKA